MLVELEGGGEPGGAGADDDDVVACGSVRGGFRVGEGSVDGSDRSSDMGLRTVLADREAGRDMKDFRP